MLVKRFLMGNSVGRKRIQLLCYSASSAFAHSSHLECLTHPDFWADSYSETFAKVFTQSVISPGPASGSS